jgi:diaphanous 1
MPDDTILVPVLLASGSLHFATVARHGTAQNVIDALIALPEVREEVLGELVSDAWALQRIRKEQNGRAWEEDELQALGDGSSSSHPPRYGAYIGEDRATEAQ